MSQVYKRNGRMSKLDPRTPPGNMQMPPHNHALSGGREEMQLGHSTLNLHGQNSQHNDELCFDLMNEGLNTSYGLVRGQYTQIGSPRGYDGSPRVAGSNNRGISGLLVGDSQREYEESPRGIGSVGRLSSEGQSLGGSGWSRNSQGDQALQRTDMGRKAYSVASGKCPGRSLEDERDPHSSEDEETVHGEVSTRMVTRVNTSTIPGKGTFIVPDGEKGFLPPSVNKFYTTIFPKAPWLTASKNEPDKVPISWRELPESIILLWWYHFENTYDWDEAKHGQQIWLNFRARCREVIGGQFADRKRKKIRYWPGWATDAKYKADSDRNKKNASKAPVHYLGAKSQLRLAAEMEAEAEFLDREVPYTEVYKRRMTPKSGPKKGKISQEIEESIEELERNVARYREKHPLAKDLPDNQVRAAVWGSTPGLGSSKNNPFRGLGSLGKLIHHKTTSDAVERLTLGGYGSQSQAVADQKFDKLSQEFKEFKKFNQQSMADIQNMLMKLTSEKRRRDDDEDMPQNCQKRRRDSEDDEGPDN